MQKIEEGDIENVSEDVKQKILIAEEDTDLENPVDLKTYEQVKNVRRKVKAKISDWANDFRRVHGKDPSRSDFEEIEDQMKEYQFFNKKYALMKAKLVR